jgi:DNA topoisomerase-1
MAKNLLIVESPAKAKTIEKILGKDFEVKELLWPYPRPGERRHGDRCEQPLPAAVQGAGGQGTGGSGTEGNSPRNRARYGSHRMRTVKGKASAGTWRKFWGWIRKRPKGSFFMRSPRRPSRKPLRIPRKIDMDLVNAQQARRVLDRLVGFELSPVLWRKIGMQRSLSAGRVQSVAVRLIVEREREINNFIPGEQL